MRPHSDRTLRLVLLRHAKAAPGSGGPDELRALTATGREQAAWVGASLAGAGLVPEVALVSAAVRTRETWQHLGAALEPAPEEDVRDELYSAGVGTVLDVVREVDDRVRTVAVVGHEPTISRTAAVLAREDDDEALLDRVRHGVPTATYAVLELTTSWSRLDPGTARLVDVVTPPR